MLLWYSYLVYLCTSVWPNFSQWLIKVCQPEWLPRGCVNWYLPVESKAIQANYCNAGDMRCRDWDLGQLICSLMRHTLCQWFIFPQFLQVDPYAGYFPSVHVGFHSMDNCYFSSVTGLHVIGLYSFQLSQWLNDASCVLPILYGFLLGQMLFVCPQWVVQSTFHSVLHKTHIRIPITHTHDATNQHQLYTNIP